MDITLTKDDEATKGFQLKLKNGYTVSVQFGPENYSDNRKLKCGGEIDGANTAETAIISPSGDFVKHKGDGVQGFQSVSDILETLNSASLL